MYNIIDKRNSFFFKNKNIQELHLLDNSHNY